MVKGGSEWSENRFQIERAGDYAIKESARDKESIIAKSEGVNGDG